jgi:hypothetical protein
MSSSLDFMSALLNLSIVEIDGYKLELPEKDIFGWSITFGSNIATTKLHSRITPFCFGEGVNFAVIPNSRQKIKLELLNGRKRAIATAIYPLDLLSKKQLFTFQQIEGIGGTYNIEFKLGHELLPHSIVKSVGGEYWHGLFFNSFKSCMLALCSVLVVVYENNEVYYFFFCHWL